MRASVSQSASSLGGEEVVDDGGAAADLPQRSAAGELADDAGLGVGEPEVVDGGGELVGGLAEDDLGGGVGEQAGGDLGGGGAVVGLGDEVGGPVGDARGWRRRRCGRA